MESNKTLVRSLKKLSPLFARIVDKALKENIAIVSRYEYLGAYPPYYQKSGIDKKRILAAWEFPEAGIDKVIIVFFEKLLNEVDNGNLGFWELAFSHEIGHNLTWELEPDCSKKPFAFKPSNFLCIYFEILAYDTGLQVLKQLGIGKQDGQFLFQGEYKSALEIFHYHDLFPWCIQECQNCPAIVGHQLPCCPKEKETIMLIKEIQKIDEY